MLAELEVYNGEQIKRGPLWYSFFAVIIIGMVIFSFFQGSLMGAISVIFIAIVIVVTYVILYLLSLKKTKIQLYDGYFIINGKIISFGDLLGFDVDIDKDGNMINFVLIFQNNPIPVRYKIISDQETTKNFIMKLIELQLPNYSSYLDNRLYKIIRFLKLG